MKLSELIAQAGDEHVTFQNLQQSLVSVNTGKKDGTITFATSREKTLNLSGCIVRGEQPDFVGLVVWIPRERMPVLNDQADSAIKCPRCEGTGTYTTFPGFVNVCAVCNGKGVVADEDLERASSEPWMEKGYSAGAAEALRDAIKGLRCIRKGLWTIDQYEAWLELCIVSASGGSVDEAKSAMFLELASTIGRAASVPSQPSPMPVQEDTVSQEPIQSTEKP